MSKWKAVHDEALGRPDRTLTVFVSDDDYGDDPQTIFEVNFGGLVMRYYDSARDAIIGEFPIADVCYGYNSLTWEHGKSDEFLDKVWADRFEEKVTTCEHEGSCEDELARAQVALGNA